MCVCMHVCVRVCVCVCVVRMCVRGEYVVRPEKFLVLSFLSFITLLCNQLVDIGDLCSLPA